MNTRMNTAEILGRIRDLIEEELGESPRFADMPAAELERTAERLARAIVPLVARDGSPRRDAA